MTHIFIFNNASRAANYGIGTYVRLLTDGLLGQNGLRVSFVDMHPDTKTFTVVDDEHGRRHYQVPAAPSQVKSDRYFRNVFYILSRHIHVEPEDRLVFHFNYFQHLTLASLLKSRYIGCRIVLTVHYLNWCFELNGNKTRFRRLTAKGYRPQDDKEKEILLDIGQERMFLSLADEVIVLSEDTQRLLTEGYGTFAGKIHLVYNGLGEGLRVERNLIHDGVRRILFVGRLDDIKGLKYLIDAFIPIAGKYPDVRLIIAGDGDFQPYLSRCRNMQGRVSFLGKVSSHEVEELYRSAYIGVMPSFHEQCSYTAIEMMRHGIPLIGTDTTGLAEMFVSTPEMCVHIDEDRLDEEDFTAQISARLDRLLSDKVAYERTAAAVGRLYEARYKVSDMVRGTVTVWEGSFARQDYILPPDFLKYMDERMIQLINQCPDIDMDFYGIGGIGVYLWKRVLDLQNNEKERAHVSSMQEHLIYYLDWVQDVAGCSPLPDEVWAMIQSMAHHGFYRTCVDTLLRHRPVQAVPSQLPSRERIIQNALKICNCKI